MEFSYWINSFLELIRGLFLFGSYSDLLRFSFLLVYFTAIFGQLPTIYQLQIKEYLWFRLKSKYNDQKRQLIPWRMPKKSVRNLMILGFGTLLTTLTVLALFIFVEEWSYLQFFAFTLLLMIFSKAYLVLAMFLTQPLAMVSRNKTIKQAQAKLDDYNDLKRVVITGSYGKTTVKDSLADVLDAKFNVAKTQKNNNSVIGVAKSIMEEVTKSTEIFVCEVGAYKPGEIADVTSYVKPNIGVLTAIGNQHLDLFGSKANLIDAKMELYFDLASGAHFYVNIDMDKDDWEGVSKLLALREDVHITTYSQIDKNADIFISTITSTDIGYDFDISVDGNSYKFHSQLEARHDILNLAPVIGIAMQLEFTVDELKTVVAGLDSKIGRLHVEKSQDSKKTIMYDTYNSTYHGFLGAIKQLSTYPGKKLVLSRGILELGKDRQISYEEIVTRINEIDAQLVTTDSDFARYDRNKLVKVVKERAFQSVVENFINNNETFTILFEGRFSTKFNNFIENIKDEYKF